MEVGRGEPAHRHCHVGTPPSEPVTPSADSVQDRRNWCLCIGVVHTLLFPKPPCPAPSSPPSQSPACPMCLPSQVMDRLQAGLSRAQVGQEGCSPGRAGQSPSHLRKGGSDRGGRGASSSSPGLAVLYGFLFLCDSTAHSYRDWSRGARRGRPAEGTRRAGTAATFPQRRRLAWPRGPSCCFPPHGWRGLKDPITALTHHPRLTPIPRLGPGMGLSSQRSG